MTMSLADNRTYELWRSFMTRRAEIHNSIGATLYSVDIYDRTYFDNFNPQKLFEKWAAVEVTDFVVIPNDMETLSIPKGLYAVFIHKGPASTGAETYRFIFETWLPGSAFELDGRPHFAVMGEKYKNEDPDSEEELWIPIRRR